MLRSTRSLRSISSSVRTPTRSYAQPAVAAAASGSSGGLSPLAKAAAEEVSSKWKGTSATGGKTKNYIGGEFVESKAEKWLEVRDPVSLSGAAVTIRYPFENADKDQGVWLTPVTGIADYCQLCARNDRSGICIRHRRCQRRVQDMESAVHHAPTTRDV